MKRILSIDGGGIRGVFPAAFLTSLEADLDQPLSDYFDLISGTSTGGIIALGLALGIPAKDILALYETQGPKIFSQTNTGLQGWLERKARFVKWATWGPKHDSKNLQKALTNTFGDKRLGDANTRLFIPSWHAKSASVYIFKTAHHDRFKSDYKELASDVAMATAAAPTYFREFMTAKGIGLVDGGIWANNPVGYTVAEALSTLGWAPSELQVLSIGCLDEVAHLKDTYGAATIASKLSGLFMAGQSSGSLGLAHTLTGDVGGNDHKAIYRISQPYLSGYYSLDDTTKISELKSRALAEARKEQPSLQKVFFSSTAEPFEPIHLLS